MKGNTRERKKKEVRCGEGEETVKEEGKERIRKERSAKRVSGRKGR